MKWYAYLVFCQRASASRGSYARLAGAGQVDRRMKKRMNESTMVRQHSAEGRRAIPFSGSRSRNTEAWFCSARRRSSSFAIVLSQGCGRSMMSP